MSADDEELHDQTAGQDDIGLDSQRAHEEELGLLTTWKQENTVPSQDEEEVFKPATTTSPWLFLLSIGSLLFALLSALLIAVVIILRLGAAVDGSSNEILEVRQPSDYILSPHWDVTAEPQRREFRWTIRDQNYNPDGVFRQMILVNSQFPGPLIEVNEGDTVVVHVDNQAANATSIHWHGIYQRGTPHMDGTVGISQCPIPPGGKFTYEFTVSGQSGTYWWHAHYGLQASDGLHGPLIIHARNEDKLQRIGYASDRIIMISDHYHDLSSALLWQYLKPDMENAEPVPSSGLINGKNVVDCAYFPDKECNNSTSNVGLAAFGLARRQKHRIRFINVGAFAEFQVQIDEHELAVTEVDGTDVEPLRYHRININPAQRYSVVVEADNSNAELFWLRARMATTCFTDPPENMQSEVRAILRYSESDSSSASDLPSSVDWEEQLASDCKDMNTTELKPVQRLSPPSEPDAFFYIRSNFEIGSYRLSRGYFNTSSWRPNVRSPSLLRAIEGLSTANASYFPTLASGTSEGATFVNSAAFDVSGELVIQTTGVQTFDILISNFDDGNHPLHLHGYKYFVLAQGDGYPPLTHPGADINLETLAPLYQSLDLSNPLRRDTASVEAFGWILLRIVADNPGAWAFHCHVAWHSEAGLLMQFLTRSDELAHVVIPQEHRDLCNAEGLERGMAPDDAAYEDLAK